MSIEVPLPEASVVVGFAEVISPMLALAEANRSESHTLSALRDGLLPKLLSSEVRVGGNTAVAPSGVFA